jgi:hypothetical protein
MGHDKNQRAWDLENVKASVLRMGVSVEDWRALCHKNFTNVPMDKMDQAVHNFHADLKRLRET